ncbi:hypothetical protein CPB84DRAFT_1351131 [Gymnopilus junonius]|uniref:Uncharacterized protein n=1 Tax=Gymnopilus junonius TaxID=109634 RepID=A0A9P5TT19_GYMJU|nr:hypothetical protein CPB84DRAFT_1351131 [Gymnopilus junonius]
MRLGLVPESGRTAQAWTARQPHITLIIFNAVACVFLLPPIFGTPFIKGIYLFEMDTPRHNSPSTQSFVEVMTFGIFGYCWKLDESMKCSNPAIGYQSGLFPAALSSIARALALHLVSAILVIITVSIHGRPLQEDFPVQVDIGFYVEAKQYYVAGDHISLGSGIWSTLGGSVLLFLGGWLYDIQSKQFLHLQHCGQVIGEPEQQLPDIESGPDPVGKHADIDVELLVEVLRSILNHRGREHEARSVAAIFGSPNVYEASSIPGPRLGDQQPVSKLRTEDDDDAKLPATNRSHNLTGF